MSRRLQSQITRNSDGTTTFSISEEGRNCRMVPLLFSTQAFVKSCTNTTKQDKGQIFGAGLQLCASGASAEAAPYGDQRHPHTVKCQAQRRAREPEPKSRGKDKTCFIVVVNLGVEHWKGQSSTPSTTHILQRSLHGRKHMQQCCHSSAIHL